MWCPQDVMKESEVAGQRTCRSFNPPVRDCRTTTKTQNKNALALRLCVGKARTFTEVGESERQPVCAFCWGAATSRSEPIGILSELMVPCLRLSRDAAGVLFPVHTYLTCKTTIPRLQAAPTVCR